MVYDRKYIENYFNDFLEDKESICLFWHHKDFSAQLLDNRQQVEGSIQHLKKQGFKVIEVTTKKNHPIIVLQNEKEGMNPPVDPIATLILRYRISGVVYIFKPLCLECRSTTTKLFCDEHYHLKDVITS